MLNDNVLTNKKMSFRNLFLTILLLSQLTGCTTMSPIDYSGFRAHQPASILVLPPINDAVDVEAPYIHLSTISIPLAEQGYYVFPVAVVDAFMKDNGLPTPIEMHQVPLDKLQDVFGADAVLYIHIHEFGQEYQLLSSNTLVKASARLVDTATGTTIWTGNANAIEQSGDGGGGILGAVIAAAVEQVIDSSTYRIRDVSRSANTRMIRNQHSGFLLGPRHPEFEQDDRGR